MKRKSWFGVSITLVLLLLVACSNDVNKERSEEFTIERAIENGDIVAKPDGTVENLTKMFDFIDKMEKNEKANIQISTFREDGKVLINELKYDGNEIEFIDKTESGEVIKTF